MWRCGGWAASIGCCRSWGAFGAALLYEAILALIYTLPNTSLDWGRYVVVALLPSALLAMVPALPVYALLRRLERWRREAAFDI